LWEIVLSQIQVREKHSLVITKKSRKINPSLSKTCIKKSSFRPIKKRKKDDRDFMQKLVVAYYAGRKIDLQNILKHELCQVPLALALESGALRLWGKSGGNERDS